MIGWLKGNLIEQNVDGSCIVDVGGVGYEVFIPLGALGKLDPGADEISLYVHTHAREDALLLYGFPTQADRLAFRALLSVSSIGPKLALAILGVLDAEALAVAIASEDRTRFKGISGVGKKTVERIMIDLRDKLPVVRSGRAAIEGPRSATMGSQAEQLLGTLTQLGYRRAEVEPVVQAVCAEGREDSLEDLLREALAAIR